MQTQWGLNISFTICESKDDRTLVETRTYVPPVPSIKQNYVCFSCVCCPVIDHEFCHNIVKVAVDRTSNKSFIRARLLASIIFHDKRFNDFQEKRDAFRKKRDSSPVKREASLEEQDVSREKRDASREKRDVSREKQDVSRVERDSSREK